MKRAIPILALLVLLAGCMSGTGAPTGERCNISFKQVTSSSVVEITQVVENDRALEVSYEANQTVNTVQLVVSGQVVETNQTVPEGTHVISVPTDQLENGTVTLRASNPENQTIAEYQINTTNCTEEG
jgi:glycine cleavage system H lipoate-binding protein